VLKPRKDISTNPIINLLNRLIRDLETHSEDQEEARNSRRSFYECSRPADWDMKSLMTKRSSKKRSARFVVKLPAVPSRLDFKKLSNQKSINFDFG